MRSVRSLAFAATLLVASSALAQEGNFPDVPKNHWAYAALARLKADGLLVGYPDGLYRGGRPMSRYELAVAIHAAYVNLKNVTDGFDAQVRALQSPGIGGTGKPEIDALKATIDGLKADLDAMKRYGAEIADLQRASDTFELELTQLGVDAQAMKDELKGLAGRVGVLERKKDPLEVVGEIDLWAGGGHGDGDLFGLDRDGRIEGTSNKGPNPTASDVSSVTHTASVLHEAAFDFRTTNETGLKVRGTVVATDAFGQNPVEGVVTTNVGFGNQSDLFSPANTFQAQTFPSRFGYAEGSGDLYLQTLAVSYSGGSYDAEAGRIQHQASSWIFRRIDNTSYFDNPRWDNGDYTFDGAHASTRLGPIAVEAYGGTNHVQTVDGVLLDPIRTGPANGFTGSFDLSERLLADRLLGGTLTSSIGGLHLRGDALFLDSDNLVLPPGGQFDRLQVYGGEADFEFGRLRFSGGLRQSDAYDGSRRTNGLAGNAWDAKVAWSSRRLDLSAQYRQVQTEYLAPGDWGRLGVLRDPTNVRGGIGKARIGLTSRLDLGLEGELSHGLENGPSGTFFDRGTDIGRFAARLDERLGKAWDGYVSYEQTVFNDLVNAPSGTPRYQWYGVGVAHALGTNTRFTLAYEQSAIRHDYQTSNGLDYRGGFLTTQVTVKF